MTRSSATTVSALCTAALLIIGLSHTCGAAEFEQRAQEVLTFYAANPSMFSRTDDVTGHAKSGIYHAMAHYATGDIAGGNEITTHIFNNVGGASMFLVMAGMDCYLRYKQHMPDALKSRIRSFVTGYGEYPFGSTENHHLMSGTGAYLASEEWPDWSKASSVKSACRSHLYGFIDMLARKGIAEYDSPTYLGFDINCMLSLYDHAQDPEMKRRAQIGLEILLADMAGEWVKGAWASSSLRAHQFCHDAADGAISGLAGYVYFGGLRMPVQSDGAGVMCAVSPYRLPAVIERMATDRSQPVTHFETHMAWHGARKTSYLDRTYGVFSQYDGNGSLFWSDQMHRAGVVWTDTTPGAKFIVKHPKSGTTGETAANQVMQHEGVLVGVAKESMTGYVPQSGTVIEQREQDGWLFLDGGTAYIAFTAAGGYTWGGTVTVRGVNPKYLIWDHSNWETVYRTFSLGGGTNKGWVIQTANPLDYDEFGAFVNDVLANGSADGSGVGNSNPTMKYTTINGDRLQITFDGSGGGGGTDRRLVNGTPIDYANWPRMHNPWVHADLYGSEMVMRMGTLVRTYHYDTWTITETGGEPDTTAPSTPTGLTATERGSSSITLSWQASSDEGTGVSGYRVYQGGADPVATTSSPTITVTGLSPNTAYEFRVSAVDYADNESGTSDALNVSTTDYDGLKIAPAASAPAIDGTVDAIWSDAVESPLMPTPVVGSVLSAADLSASFHALWDTARLYLLVSVADDALQDDSPELWRDDGVEIMIDIGNDKAGAIGSSDFQFLVSADGDAMVEDKHAATAGVTAAGVTVSGGYVVEIAIPWSTVGLSEPAAQVEIGLNVAVDDDDDGGERDAQIAWKGTGDNYRNPSLWGTAMLSSDATARTGPVRRIAGMGGELSVRTMGSILAIRKPGGARGLVVRIYDARGRLASATVINGAARTASIDLRRLPHGSYIYEVLGCGAGPVRGRVPFPTE